MRLMLVRVRCETFNQVDIVYCSGKHEHVAAVCLENDRVAVAWLWVNQINPCHPQFMLIRN